MSYDWVSSIYMFVLVALIVLVAKRILFLNPDIQNLARLNAEQDKKKMAKAKYPPAVKNSRVAGLVTYALLFIVVIPFSVNASFNIPLWRYVSDVVLILLLHDFIYYITHRFLFHGKGYFRRVHALHHQARQVSNIDGYYVHPVETVMGLMIFAISIFTVAYLYSGVNIVPAALSFIIFTQISIINHTVFNLNYFPFRFINYLNSKHHVHHENMQMGNYSGITVLFDWLFGTLENSGKTATINDK